jgi:hypothetical protein
MAYSQAAWIEVREVCAVRGDSRIATEHEYLSHEFGPALLVTDQAQRKGGN